MAWKKINDTKLTAIANAIRGKTGKTAAMTLDAMPTEIANIQTGGSTETCTLTVNAQTQNPFGPSATQVFCLLADGGAEWWHHKDTRKAGTTVYTLPKPCLVGIDKFISISGDYEDSYVIDGLYYVYGDVTVEGYYDGSLSF